MGRQTRAAALALALAIAVAGCTFPPLRTPTPSPSPSPSPTPSPSPSATPSPTPTPEPTPDAAAIPGFAAGEIVATAIDGLRVRQRPSLSSVVVAGLLALGTELEVAMGPILIEEQGWYLVRDADPDEPAFGEGWIASGFQPEPFLASTGRTGEQSPFVAAFAQTGNAEYGPVEIGEGDYAIRWVATDPERVRCQFSVALAAGGGTPVPAIRATVGNGVDPGTLQPGSFAALGVRGQTFISVESDCAWTLAVTRLPPASPSPTPSPTPTPAP
ncbi:MAG: SH3 domain-containing protein [Chloroflexota bacterium]|nr:SH3 domain-containing protein [Chloroflexota bacterium]